MADRSPRGNALQLSNIVNVTEFMMCPDDETFGFETIGFDDLQPHAQAAHDQAISRWGEQWRMGAESSIPAEESASGTAASIYRSPLGELLQEMILAALGICEQRYDSSDNDTDEFINVLQYPAGGMTKKARKAARMATEFIECLLNGRGGEAPHDFEEMVNVLHQIQIRQALARRPTPMASATGAASSSAISSEIVPGRRADEDLGSDSDPSDWGPMWPGRRRQPAPPPSPPAEEDSDDELVGEELVPPPPSPPPQPPLAMDMDGVAHCTTVEVDNSLDDGG